MAIAGMEYYNSTVGSNASLPYLTKWFRTTAQPLMRFRQLCDVKEAIGTRKGNTFCWDIFSNIATAGTQGLTESNAMPTTSFTIAVGTCVVTEYGNSIPLTRKMKDMSQPEIQQILRNTLVNDMAKTIDKAVWAKLCATLLVAQASGAGGTDTSNIVLYENGTGTSDAAGTAGLSTGHVLNIVDAMKERNIPTFDGTSYVCVSHPSTFAKLRESIITANQYTESGAKGRMSGEIGSFGGVRFVEQTNIGKLTVTNGGSGVGWALFVGGEACVEAVAVPEELIEKEVTDYGRSLGLAWYANLGFALPFGTASATNQRAVLWYPEASVPFSVMGTGVSV